MKHPEQKIQTAIVVAFRRKLDVFCYHVPNSGARSTLQALAFKGAGLTAGVPDLVAVGHDGRHLYLEVKAKIQVRERNVPLAERITSVSDSQKIVIPELRARGCTVVVVDSVEDAIAAGEAFGFVAKPAAVRSACAARTGF